MAQRVQCGVRYLEYFIFIASGAVLLAIQAVMDDPGFEVSSPLATNVVQTATQLQEWSQSVENKLYFDGFASQFVSELETAFWPSSGGHKRLRVQREKMWGQYHLILSSAVFREMWFGILHRLHDRTPCPIFYQYVTDNAFKQLIIHHCSASERSHDTHWQLPDLMITYEETSALRYAAGYVCRAMRKEFKSNPDVLAAIEELIDDSNGEGDEGSDCSNDWTKLASHGGLLFMKDTTYYGFSCHGIGCKEALLQGANRKTFTWEPIHAYSARLRR